MYIHINDSIEIRNSENESVKTRFGYIFKLYKTLINQKTKCFILSLLAGAKCQNLIGY